MFVDRFRCYLVTKNYIAKETHFFRVLIVIESQSFLEGGQVVVFLVAYHNNQTSRSQKPFMLRKTEDTSGFLEAMLTCQRAYFLFYFFHLL